MIGLDIRECVLAIYISVMADYIISNTFCLTNLSKKWNCYKPRLFCVSYSIIVQTNVNKNRRIDGVKNLVNILLLYLMPHKLTLSMAQNILIL